MPNHITNIIKAKPEVLDALCVTEDGKRVVDFNTLITMPEKIKHTHPTFSLYNNGNADNWYDWSVQNWDTKWNAYGQPEGQNDPDTLRFETAWSHPESVIRVLSRLVPDETIQVAYADEDTGYNLDVYTIRNGERISHAPWDAGSPEAINLATLIMHGMTSKALNDSWDEEPEFRKNELDDYYDPFSLTTHPEAEQ